MQAVRLLGNARVKAAVEAGAAKHHERVEPQSGVYYGCLGKEIRRKPMPVYVCRWPNGDCSVVQARDKKAAIIKLDEVANPEGCPLIKLDECQIHFPLTDEGQLELQSLGEETESGIWRFGYPLLDGVLPEKNADDWSESEREAVH